MTRRMGTKIISVEKQRVRDAMRVVCSPMSFDVRRKECESFLDAMFRANFEENAEVTLDILKSVGQKNECEQEPAEVAVFVSKCVLFYVRKAKTTDDASSLVQILFRSIATNELLSLRGKEIGSVGEFSALRAAVASMKMVKTEADVETLVESSAVHFRTKKIKSKCNLASSTVAEVRISHFHSAEKRHQNDPTRVFLSTAYSTRAMGVRKVTEIDRACYINFDERFWKNHTPT